MSAGIFAARLMAEKEVKAVIAGNVGPRASEVLEKFKIKVYLRKGVVKNVLSEFLKNTP